MARFKKHVIVYGDTPQIIAEKEMGDVSLWIELVQYNNLEYPYIVDTPEERNKNPRHLVTLGNTIIIPIEKTLADVDTTTISKPDKLALEDIVLGTDLKLDSVDKEFSKHGTEDEIVGLTGSGKGDIGLIKGRANIVQMLKLRLLTPKGSLIMHPDYGTNFQYLIGKKNNLETAELISESVQEQLEADNRIKSARMTGEALEGEYYAMEWEIKLQDFDTYFTILIQRDNDNNFIIM